MKLPEVQAVSSISLDSKFNSEVAQLQQSIADATSAFVKGSQVPWFKLANGSAIDGFDHKAIMELFNRDGTAKAYSDSLTPDSSYRHTQAAKVQGDILSAFERDFRMRTRSRIRMMAHAVSRMKTHSLPKGPIVGGVLKYVQLLLDSGPTE
jgi:hypothetical protein